MISSSDSAKNRRCRAIKSNFTNGGGNLSGITMRTPNAPALIRRQKSNPPPLQDITNVSKQPSSTTVSQQKRQNIISSQLTGTDTSSSNVQDFCSFINSAGQWSYKSIARNITPKVSVPLSDYIENVPVKRKRRKLLSEPVSPINLFPSDETFPHSKNVDYNAIENSEIEGLSDMADDGSCLEADIESDVEELNNDTMHSSNHNLNADEWCQKKISGLILHCPEIPVKISGCDFCIICNNILLHFVELPKGYKSLGPPTATCLKCGATMWKEERVNKKVTKKAAKFTLCCGKGRVHLPPAKPTPPFLLSLYNNKSTKTTFRKCIRMYNSMFSFTSMGGHIDRSINRGGAPFVFRLNGQNHHQFGSLLPKEGDQPKFCQLYIYDTENELGNRIRCINVNDTHNVHSYVVEGLLKMLDETNHLVKCFRMARDRFKEEQIVDLKIVLKVSRAENGRENHITPSDEVAAVMVGDIEDTCGRRDIVIDSKIDGLKRISDIHPLLMALQYPLLFPYGEDGFHENILYIDQPNEPALKRKTVSMREYYAYMLQVRPAQGMTLRLGGRLYQQFVVDAFSAIEQSRLWYIRCNQKTLRNELYTHIRDFMKEGDGDMSNLGRGFILPSSFVGSKRYMQQNFQDALAVCRYIGHPDLFLTMTCNPMWEEVLQMLSLLPNCRPVDCPDIIARVFKLKLKQLTDEIKKKKFFGNCIAVMYVVEWQKRGLPHVHMLIWLDSPSKKILNSNVDKFVSAEIPDMNSDPIGYEAVKTYMIHGPCGLQRPKSSCMKDCKCTRRFPKRYCPSTIFDDSGFPVYRRRKTNNVVHVRKAILDNQWVVPYNRKLLIKFQCHINVEICNRARCLKYLFKYCLKGSDRATVEVTRQKKKKEALTDNGVDEIQNFFDGRYVCGAEACHRIFSFDIHHRSVSVERLPFHLEGKKSIIFKETAAVEQVINDAENKLSKLEAFFILNQSDPEACKYTYDQIPQKYVWCRDDCQWIPRQRGLHIGRLTYTHHSTGELWYLRMLLSKICGPTSYADLRTVDGVVMETFQQACNALGLLDDDKEWHEAMTECDKSGFAIQLRNLFVQIIVNCQVSDLKALWQAHWRSMAADILYIRSKLSGNTDIKLSDKQLENFTLAEIDTTLRAIGRKVQDFAQLPQPPARYLNPSRNNLIHEESLYDETEMGRVHDDLLNKCNTDQRKVYDAVLTAVDQNKGGLFFVYGSGGCGKTFLWNTIITKLRSESKIVLPVASSGIAATLLPGGRTAHSRFKIPIILDDLSSCAIATNSDIAELIRRTSLIIWDEAPMQHRYAFEALDRTLRDIMKSVSPYRYNLPFGGIPILLGGDFRQILPVIKWGSRSDIVSACITRSRLWNHCTIFHLHKNMRLGTGKSIAERKSLLEFGEWVLNVGDGKNFSNQTQSKPGDNQQVQFNEDHCIHSTSDSIQGIISSTFPDLHTKYNDTKYLTERAILTPTNQTVSHINNMVLDNIPGDCYNYFSADKAEEVGNFDSVIDLDYPAEYLNSLSIPGLPAHHLKIKLGCVVMLMRNLNQILGLCNGTRLIVRQCLKHTIECEVLSGNSSGQRHYIPRMELSPTDYIQHVKLVRRQFPVQLCYAMTINKAQGQSLEMVGLYLPRPVFTHGQLYVALSRVTSPQGLKVLIETDEGKTSSHTSNVVYEEVFYHFQ